MSSLRLNLKGRVPLLGLNVMYPSAGALERIGPDWDWIWLDGQHGQLGYADLLQLVRVCDLIDRPALVRVPGHETGPISLALDMDVAGVIVPCVDTPEQALSLARAAKFPPIGNRSYGGRRPIDRRGRAYAECDNDDTLLVVQIETASGINNADAIAAIPGVDALFLGPDDLALRQGLRMQRPRPPEALLAEMQILVNVCRKHNKIAVMVGVGDEMLKLCLDMGFHLIVAGGDVPFLAAGSKEASTRARATIKRLAEPTLLNGDGRTQYIAGAVN